MPIRVVNEFAWHNLFARNMFAGRRRGEAGDASAGVHGHRFPRSSRPTPPSTARARRYSSSCTSPQLVLIGGTHYAGEIKKSIFTILNYMPLQGVMPMHCSANVGDDGDTALFFGLSAPARPRCRATRAGA